MTLELAEDTGKKHRLRWGLESRAILGLGDGGGQTEMRVRKVLHWF